MAPDVSKWSVNEVLTMLDDLNMGDLKQRFKDKAISGRSLLRTRLVLKHEPECVKVGFA